MEFDEEYDAFSSTGNQDLEPCHICDRSFNPTTLNRHIPICEKAASKKRKVFDAAKQRAEGTDIKLQKNRPKPGTTQVRTNATTATHAPPKSNWRAKHQDFISTIRAARGVQKAMAEGGPLPPPPPPSINPDYVQCPYCSRRFKESAAERHINFCKEQSSRLPAKKAISQASMSRADARKNYSPPKPLSKTGTGSSGRVPSSGATNTRNYGGSRGTGSSTLGGTSSSARGPGSVTGSGYGGSGGNYSASRYATPTVEKESPKSSGNLPPLPVAPIDGGVESPGSGRALRTGRTTETYSEAQELSAKQRSAGLGSNATRRTAPTGIRSKYGSSGSRTGMSPVTGNGYKMSENGYYSAEGGDSYGSQQTRGPPSSTRAGPGSGGMARFCHECGTKYPVATAKFCCECGIRRETIS